MDISIKTVWIVLLLCIFGQSEIYEMETFVKRGTTKSLSCVLDSFGKDEVDEVEWFFTPEGTDQKVKLLKWIKEDDTKLEETSISRHEFNVEKFELDVKFTNFGDTGTYDCLAYQSQNGSRILVSAYGQHLLVNDSPSQPPGQPELQPLNATSMLVTWQKSTDDNNSPITGYMILIRTRNIADWDNAMKIFEPGNKNSTILAKLSPYTEYQVRVRASNQAGYSLDSDSSDFVRTEEGLPTGKPRIQHEHIKKYTDAIYIEFSPPLNHTLNGKMVGYTLTYKKHLSSDSQQEAFIEPTETKYNITGLKAYSVYEIQLAVVNGAGAGPEVELSLWTDEGLPGAPRITNIKNRTDMFIQLEWEKPMEMNGLLDCYIIFWTNSSGGAEAGYAKRIPLSDPAQDIMTYTLMHLAPYTQYSLQVAAKTGKGQGSKSAVYPGLTDVKGPSAPSITNITTNSSSTILVQWLQPRKFFRQVSRYVIITKNNNSESMETVVEGTGQEVEEGLVGELQPDTEYSVAVYGQTKSLFYDRYYSGDVSHWERITLEKLPSAETSPLPPDTGGHEGRSSGAVAGIVAGVVCTAVLFIVIVVFFIVLRRHLKSTYGTINDPPPNGPGPEIILPDAYVNCRTSLIGSKNERCVIRDDVPVERWHEHVMRNHADGDLQFSQEYDDINQATRCDLTHNSSADADNTKKNRYVNIVAYDHSRVKLKTPTGKPKTDYINANYVDGYHEPRAYIAAQGPLPQTFAEFWTMVWEQNSSVIVMITNLTERGRRKCDQYWPTEGDTKYGQFYVKLLSTVTTAHYTVRELGLGLARGSMVKKKLSHERIVKQFHYTDWPDHGVPYFTLPVLQYVRKCVAANREGSGPPIVHCSAGVGRTGTFIVLDAMIRQAADRRSINVFSFLSHIRNQRNFLVQTEEQYIFIHDALLEHVSAGVTEVRDVAAYLATLTAAPATTPPGNGAGDGKEDSLLVRQFKLVSGWRPPDYLVSQATAPYNTPKNRSQTILPVDTLRVRLPAKPGVQGSDYINASYLQGYNKNEEYIVTQHPLATTVADFWRMVWDQNSLTIVLLSSTNDQEYGEFWPQLKTTAEYGHFNVTLTEEKTPLNFVTRDFLLQSTEDDYECTTRMISTTYWPESCDPITSVFELIHTVRQWDQQQEQQVEGPIIVIDRFGGCEAATFCALSTLYDQLRHEAAVDVYTVAKLYHLKRPGIFSEVEEYHFLYKAIESIAMDDSLVVGGDKDSGIGNCNNYPATPMVASLPTTPISRSVSHMSNAAAAAANGRAESTM